MRGRASRGLARKAAGDLGYYETKFLTMQKKIFEDQAGCTRPTCDGGMDDRGILRRRIIDSATLQAWQQIDKASGRRDAPRRGCAIADVGNRALLFREQHDIIDRFYVRMLGVPVADGPGFTYLLTLAGAPSVPGAHSYPEQYPLRVDARLPRVAISAQTPLADGNIAVFADRWKLIDSRHAAGLPGRPSRPPRPGTRRAGHPR